MWLIIVRARHSVVRVFVVRDRVPGNCSFLQERDSIHYLEDFACGPLAYYSDYPWPKILKK